MTRQMRVHLSRRIARAGGGETQLLQFLNIDEFHFLSISQAIPALRGDWNLLMDPTVVITCLKASCNDP